MFVRQATRNKRRRGSTLVETALVLPIILLFLFGIFEYGRFVFLYTTATNAVRDGARYAIVHTSDTTVDSAFIIGIVTGKMGGLHQSLTGYNVDVWFADPVGLAANPAVIQVHPSFTGAEDWKQAAYGDKIAVRITGIYRPTMAQMLLINTTRNVGISSVMTSEGN